MAETLSLHERCCRIEMLLVDVDGVLTDGAIVYGNSGEELKTFHVRDGSALKIWTMLGKRAGLLSGRKSAVVERRAAELGLATVIQGAADKLEPFERIVKEQRLRPAEVCYVGDDLPDLPVLRRCGLAAAVADACQEAKDLAHYVTVAAGGRGAVREVVELVLRAQGRWQEVIETFLR
jgi:3-deoxy-D-manno-octulosonate 8-phosphate phosphatase (KDO 8-P phosphatase)